MVLKIGRFGKYLKKDLEILKCGAGEGRSRSVQPFVWKTKYYFEPRRNKNLNTIKWRKANWNVHILRGKYLLKHIFEGRTEKHGRRARRRKQLQNDLRERTWFCKLKEEAQDCTCWGPYFGKGSGPVVRQTTKRMNVFGIQWGGNFTDQTSRRNHKFLVNL
jgi:hypothetical protein